MDDKRHLLLLASMALLAALALQGCSPPPPPSASQDVAEPAPRAPAAPAPAPERPQPPSVPRSDTAVVEPGGTASDKIHVKPVAHDHADRTAAASPAPPPVPVAAASTPSPYPHVEAIFYAETPEQVGQVSKACLEVLPPGVSAASVDPAAYQCKPESAGAAMTPGAPVAKDDGTPGVDSAEYMKATLDVDSDDFEVPTRELLLHFTSPGQHKSFEFQVIPKRIGERQLTVRLFTTDKDGVVIDDIFDGRSTVRVDVAHDAVDNLGWLLDHWEALAAVCVSLGALLTWLKVRPPAWWRRRRSSP